MEQLALAYLLRFGRGTMESVQQEVSSVRPASHTDVGLALVRLTTAGLVESRLTLAEERGETAYFPTKKGERLRRRIPAEPKTVIEFWL
jgi:hypothetical protein